MKRQTIVLAALILGGCAGIERSCSSFNAQNFASDWIVVQNDVSMAPKRCWRLSDTSITNEDKSDGIYWLSSHGLVHISGWYNRVQVRGGDWAAAAATLGIELAKCNDGIYAP